MSALSAVLSPRVWRFLVRNVHGPHEFELIPTAEMETRNPVEGNFDSEFPAICNHCEVMAA